MLQRTHIGANGCPQLEQAFATVPTIRRSRLAQAVSGDTKPTSSGRERERGLLAALAHRGERAIGRWASRAVYLLPAHSRPPQYGDVRAPRQATPPLVSGFRVERGRV